MIASDQPEADARARPPVSGPGGRVVPFNRPGLLPDTPSGGWYWVVARGTQRVTADEAPGGKPDASHGAVTIDSFCSVVRTRGQEPA